MFCTCKSEFDFSWRSNDPSKNTPEKKSSLVEEMDNGGGDYEILNQNPHAHRSHSGNIGVKHSGEIENLR